jgi:hypothetical protein
MQAMSATGTVHVERIARPTYGARRRDALTVEAVERREHERQRDADRRAARALKRAIREGGR